MALLNISPQALNQALQQTKAPAPAPQYAPTQPATQTVQTLQNAGAFGGQPASAPQAQTPAAKPAAQEPKPYVPPPATPGSGISHFPSTSPSQPAPAPQTPSPQTPAPAPQTPAPAPTPPPQQNVPTVPQPPAVPQPPPAPPTGPSTPEPPPNALTQAALDEWRDTMQYLTGSPLEHIPNAIQTIDMSEWEKMMYAQPVTGKVQPNQTVAQQMKNVLAENSPYVEQARRLAAEQMQARGLLNSTMAADVGSNAAIAAALPIAQQDAQTYSQQAFLNQNAQNEFLGREQQTGLQGMLNQLNAQLNTAQAERLAHLNNLFQTQQDYRSFGLQGLLSDQNFRQQMGLGEQQFGHNRILNQDQFGYNQSLANLGYQHQLGLGEQGFQHQLGLGEQQFGHQQQLNQDRFAHERAIADANRRAQAASQMAAMEMQRQNQAAAFEQQMAMADKQFEQQRQLKGEEYAMQSQQGFINYAAGVNQQTEANVSEIMNTPGLTPEQQQARINLEYQKGQNQINFGLQLFSEYGPNWQTDFSTLNT